MENGALHVQRIGGAKRPLLALGSNLFVVEADPDTQLEFAVADGSTPSVEIIRANGTRMRMARAE